MPIRLTSIPLDDLMERPKTFDEEMKEGRDLGCGIAGRRELNREYQKGARAKHRTTRDSAYDDYSDY